jgi:hypothetical protein
LRENTHKLGPYIDSFFLKRKKKEVFHYNLTINNFFPEEKQFRVMA